MNQFISLPGKEFEKVSNDELYRSSHSPPRTDPSARSSKVQPAPERTTVWSTKKEDEKREFASRMGASCSTSTSGSTDGDIVGKIWAEQKEKTNPHLTNKVVEKRTEEAQPPAPIQQAQRVEQQPTTAQVEREVPIAREVFVPEPKTKEQIFMASYRIPRKKK
ncbi:hypothetical protein B9Z55_026459 [Caenorhabditis nigoni]|uniref:Uncharacterized protein n=1 Tax=Caenorhabditis nigoni TaxID=1611254 RepID=A0A2G5T2W1_9PELO|nr:hypothetical protein B9Z55_026459 [Caenorhabditis nigoni]